MSRGLEGERECGWLTHKKGMGDGLYGTSGEFLF